MNRAEANKRIHEELMGLCWHNWIFTEGDTAGFGECNCSKCPEPYEWDSSYRKSLPNYCENLLDAFAAIEKLRNSHRYCCIKFDSDYNYVWDVSLTYGLNLESHLPHITTEAETLPLAISVAILVALDIEKEPFTWVTEKDEMKFLERIKSFSRNKLICVS